MAHPTARAAVVVLAAAAAAAAGAADGPDRAAMVELWGAWGAAVGWNETSSECSWLGVSCAPASGRVTGLTLTQAPVGGGVPAALGNLTALETLSLTVMELAGPVPSWMGAMRSLQVL